MNRLSPRYCMPVLFAFLLASSSMAQQSGSSGQGRVRLDLDRRGRRDQDRPRQLRLEAHLPPLPDNRPVPISRNFRLRYI